MFVRVVNRVFAADTYLFRVTLLFRMILLMFKNICKLINQNKQETGNGNMYKVLMYVSQRRY